MRFFIDYVRAHRAPALLLAAFCVLAIFYSLVIPLFEGPDEDDHFRYVKFIADHRALPVQEFKHGGGEAGHQGWQPPLYYALAALIIMPIDTSDFSEHLIRNEYATVVGDPTCCGRNLYYHFGNENLPYTRTTLAVHLARLLSILFGAITVAATYGIASTVFPRPSGERVRVRGDVEQMMYLPLAAASLVAFNPSFLFVSAIVSNDTALAAFASLTLLAWVKLIRDDLTLNLKSSVMLSTLIALAALAKTTALALVPLTILLFVVLAWRKRDARMLFFAVFVYFAVFVLLTSWWFVRNYILYGDPLAARLISVSALFPRIGELTLSEFFQISLPQIWTTFWGGPTPSDFSPIILIALAVLTALAAIGMTLYAIRNTNYELRTSFYFLLSWLALLFLAMIQFVRTTQGGDQGRYLFPAISVIGLYFALGLNEILLKFILLNSKFIDSNLNFRVLNLSFVIGSFVIGLFVPFAYTLPAYARPALLSTQDQARFASRDAARTNFASQIELLGSELGARSIKPGETLRVTLYWRAITQMPASYRVFVHLVGRGNRVAGGVDAIPIRGAFPTLYWRPGDALKDNYYLPINPNASPGKYAVEVGLYPIGNLSERLVTITGDDRVAVGVIKIAPRAVEKYAPAFRADAVFADQIELFGSESRWVANGLQVNLYWRARTTIQEDYKVFVHALDASGKIIAQVDREPQDGNYPTSIWERGEEILDEYIMPVNLSSGVKRLAIGLYRADSGARLTAIYLGKTDDHIEMTLGVTQ